MMDVSQAAVEAAQGAGAEYADARVVRLESENLNVRNGDVVGASAPEEFGLGVRVLVNGSWGFSSTPLSQHGSPEEMRARAPEFATRAVNLARAVGVAQVQPVDLGPGEGAVGEYAAPCDIDPFSVSLADKLDLLQDAAESMAGADETVSREASLGQRREEQWQASSDGARQHQLLVRCGAGISTTASAHGHVETRSWPASFGGSYRAAGWEFIQGLDLAAHGERMRDESVALCSAEACPAGRRDLILMGNQLMLQIHESVGHPNELDRVFGHEVDLAGSSFATTEKLNSFRYGSDIVNLVADSTVPGGLDTRGFDDECVPSGRWHVVKDGLFTGYHTSREWAARIGEERSRGTARAEGFGNPPIIRITNLSLMPGDWQLDKLIADTEDGVLCDTVRMWSIDQRRLNFQFTTEIGWEIKDGQLGRMLRSPTYQDTTPEFWGRCDAICDGDHWQLWGVPNCGKGNPMQLAEMSHGAAPARFRAVNFVR